MTEQELLLLDNLMYLDAIENTDYENVRDIVDNYLSRYSDNPNSVFFVRELSGGFEESPERMIEILREISKNERLMNLQIGGDRMKGDVRANCFIDGEGNVTIAFRGTGGSYVAWYDNVRGLAVADTDLQKKSAEWFKQICEKNNYSNVTLTGHSKGGNIAMYLTVTAGEYVARCVSFDGQGFSDYFLSKYKNEITAASEKITSISAYNDFVNILLHPIAKAENIKFLANNATGTDAHSSYTLYMTNYGENGEYTEIKQDLKMKWLHSFVNDLVSKWNPAERIILSELLGGPIAGFMSGELGFFDIVKAIVSIQALQIKLPEIIMSVIKASVIVGVTEIIEFVAPILQELIVQIQHQILKSVDAIKILVADFLNNLGNLIKQGADFVREKAAELFGKINDAIDNAVFLLESTADSVKNFISGAAASVADKVSGVAASVGEKAANIFNGLKTKVDNAVNVTVNALNSAKDKAAETAAGIWRDLSGIVGAVMLGQPETWEEKLQNVIRKLEAFVNEFESNIPALVNVSIREVNNVFREFEVIRNEISKDSGVNLKSGVGTFDIAGNAGNKGYYTHLGSGKIGVNIDDLKKVKGQAEDLLREIESRAKITNRARMLANESMTMHNQNYVRNDGTAVVNTCAKFETNTARVRNELNNVIRGISSAIDGYIKLEREFA